MKDFVICPICGKKLKEINNSHLKIHKMNISEYDKLYPDSPRLSEQTRLNKATFTGKKHSEKHKKYMSEVMKGKHKGRKLSKEHKNKIGKASKNSWIKNRKRFTKSRTLEGYIEKYGNEEGKKKWYMKNIKNSESSKIIKNKKDYDIYCEWISVCTNYTLENFKIDGIEKIKKFQFHLDHKYSKAQGFKKGIPPWIIGSPENLQVVSCSYNCSKQALYGDIDENLLIDKTYKNKKYINGIIKLLGYINEIRTSRTF